MSLAVVVLGNDEQMVRRIESYRGELIVVRACSSVAEAVAACAAAGAQVLLVSGRELLPGAEQLDYLAGLPVAVVLLEEDPVQGAALPGVLELPASSGIGQVQEAVQHLLEAEGSRPPASAPQQAGPEPGAEGRIICFWGASGSPGRSTVALNYAVEAANAGRRVVLLDADTYSASIAIQLALMDESASIAQLCRVVDAGSQDPARLVAACSTVQVADASLQVATGIPRAGRWPEVRAAALRRAAALLRSSHDLVVVDVAPYVELDEQQLFDTSAPQRNAVTAEMLQCADEVFMVVAADSLGVPRALRAVDELAENGVETRLKIVFNKVSASSTGRNPKLRVQEAWDRFGPDRPIAAYLPYDGPACRAAVLAGCSLLELAPSSALRTEIRALLGQRSTVRRARRRSRRSNPK